MRSGIILFTLGIASGGLLYTLPPLWWCVLAVPPVLLLVCITRTRLLGDFVAGFLCFVLQGHLQLIQQLPLEFEDREIVVTGFINSIPVAREHGMTADMVLVDTPLTALRDVLAGRQIRLAWFKQEKLAPGEMLSITVKLRCPRGLVNEGSFDYQRYLLEQGYVATGYVRVLHGTVTAAEPLSWWQALQFHNAVWRVRAWQRLQAQLSPDVAGMMGALLLGEKHVLSNELLQLFIRTGTIHLLVVSGSHITLAAIAGLLLFSIPGRILAVWWPLSARQIALPGALLTACLYSVLTGLTPPTLRSLLMFSCLLGGHMLQRKLTVLDSWLFALAVILLYSPLSIFSLSCWLSFAAVGILMFMFSARPHATQWYWKWLVPHGAIFTGLLPLFMFVGLSSSPLSMLYNFVAIPYVTVFVMPPAFLALVLAVLPWDITATPWCAWLWRVLQWLGDGLLWLLQQMVQLLEPQPWQLPFAAANITVTLCLLAAFWLMWQPVSRRYAYLLLLVIVPLLWPQKNTPPENTFQVTFLDVGQGTAVVVQTAQHVLLYDTGPRYSASFDAGSGVVAPWLKAQGVRQLDAIVLSHTDMDHVGGYVGLRSLYEAHIVYQDNTAAPVSDAIAARCNSGMHWQWDGVQFAFLHPAASEEHNKPNLNSCVLTISVGQHAVLLSGDIEQPVEAVLSTQSTEILRSDILLAPHHGSKTSSSTPFLQAVAPQWGIVTAGYRSRYGHPAAPVLQRYTAIGTQVLNTAHTGAIGFTVTPQGVSEPTLARVQQRGYWLARDVERVRVE